MSVDLTRPVRVLLVEDDPEDFTLTCAMLEESEGEFDVHWASTYDAGLEATARGEHDVILLDYRLGPRSGIELLGETASQGCGIPVILLTGAGSRDIDILAMRAGASDYLAKSGLSAPELERTIRYAVERKRAEERVRTEQTALLEAALTGLEEAVGIVDPAGRFVYANPAHARLYGCDPARLPDLRIFDFLAGPDRRQEFAAVMAAAQGGGWSGSISRRGEEGEERPVRARVSHIVGCERDLFLIVSHDASGELTRERRMRQAEQLASIGTLLSGVAHELKNPLHAISSFSQLLLMDPRPETDREALEIMQREAERASRIVSDLRVLSRPAHEKSEERCLVDLNDVVRHVLKLRRYTEHTHNIQVVERLISSPPAVRANRSEMEQVMLNLVLNAEQAMNDRPEGGRLTVRTSAGRAGVIVQVTDSGPGIPLEHLSRIFDPFFTTKGAAEGTGLGLSLVRTIVEEHGGKVTVSSTPGSGTTFTVELPRAREQATPIPPPAPLPRATTALRVLVVDDEPAIRRSIQVFLERRGHHVALAASGDEALRLLRGVASDRRYDAILSDVRMPGLSGEKLLAQLEREGMGQRVVFMTGDEASASTPALLEATTHQVLCKPVPLDVIAAAVERVGRLRDPVNVSAPLS